MYVVAAGRHEHRATYMLHTTHKHTNTQICLNAGDNAYGQLGIDATAATTANVGTAASEMGDNLQAVNLGTGRCVCVCVCVSGFKL